ncbi:MAG TPA: hypothetical protein VFD62_17500 [Pyrinomonadaceae bacterium]|nr:hypothetical protein [Pyrinomonadaceae bacterium]
MSRGENVWLKTVIMFRQIRQPSVLNFPGIIICCGFGNCATRLAADPQDERGRSTVRFQAPTTAVAAKHLSIESKRTQILRVIGR